MLLLGLCCVGSCVVVVLLVEVCASPGQRSSVVNTLASQIIWPQCWYSRALAFQNRCLHDPSRAWGPSINDCISPPLLPPPSFFAAMRPPLEDHVVCPCPPPPAPPLKPSRSLDVSV